MNLMSHDGSPLFIGSKSLTTHKQSQLKCHKVYFNSLDGNESLPLNMGSMEKGSIWINEVEVNGGEQELLDNGSCKREEEAEHEVNEANKLGPKRKMQLARALSFQPRQIVIWFSKQKQYMVNLAIGEKL